MDVFDTPYLEAKSNGGVSKTSAIEKNNALTNLDSAVFPLVTVFRAKSIWH
jgi:hypothetical protein